MMNRILLSLLSTGMIISNICAWSTEEFVRASQQYNYSKAQFDADMEQLSKDNPEFTAKFEQTKADFGESACRAVRHSIFSTPNGIIYAAAGALLGTIAGHFVNKKAIGATIGGTAGMVTGTCMSINDWLTLTLDNERHYKLNYGEESPEAMAAIWAKNNKWAALFTSSENSSTTAKRNKWHAELQEAMQDPQFKENFIHRVQIGAQAARHDAGQSALKGAQVGAKYGAIGGAIAGAITSGMRQLNANKNSAIPVKGSTVVAALMGAAIGTTLGTTTGAAICGSIGAIAGAVDSLNSGCDECGRRRIYDSRSGYNINHDTTIDHKAKDVQNVNFEAAVWVKKHNLRTLSTLSGSTRLVHNLLDAEFGQ